MTGDAMRPHPRGLPGRVADALEDLQLMKQAGVPPVGRRWAQLHADALEDALRAESDTAE